MAFSFKRVTIDSQHLGESRGMSLLVPRDRSLGLVLFCADGQAVESLRYTMAEAVISGFIPPVFMIGVHSSEHRAQEYIRGIDTERFSSHESFC